MIRQATTGDAQAVKELLIQLGYPGLDIEGVEGKIRQYSEPDHCLLVSEVEQGVVGFISLHCYAIFHSPGKMGKITAFCVEKQFRSQGIGIKLLEAAETFFREQGCTKIEVTSNHRRTETHAFYIRRGYTDNSRKFVKLL